MAALWGYAIGTIGASVGELCWDEDDRAVLVDLQTKLREAGHPTGDIDAELSALAWRDWGGKAGIVAAGHAAFWVLLIAAYPRSATVQTLFFWNPWVRRIAGLGYVGFLLAYVPFLRRRLLAPFRSSLLEEADREHFDEAAWFDASRVGDDRGRELGSAEQIIPAVRGRIVLVGKSGLGKSMLLRRLALRSRRIAVFLPARRCAEGVIPAIQAKLQGTARDETFLRTLVYSGALDLCIDGLNEVSAATREKVAALVDENFHGNIVVATQPMEWQPPRGAKVYRLLPLARDEIEGFLVSRTVELPAEAPVKGDAFRAAARSFLARTFDAFDEAPERQALQAVLSNPMDLVTVAAVLARGQTPDLLALHEQAYALMAADYADRNEGTSFPLDRFAERVYAMRLAEEKALADPAFEDELLAMERHKMLLRRVTTEGAGNSVEWRFRHDKIIDFFLFHAFRGEHAVERQTKHLGDPPFRGVYLLLALRAPIEQAELIKEMLVERGAETGEHSLTDAVVLALKARRAAIRA